MILPTHSRRPIFATARLSAGWPSPQLQLPSRRGSSAVRAVTSVEVQVVTERSVHMAGAFQGVVEAGEQVRVVLQTSALVLALAVLLLLRLIPAQRLYKRLSREPRLVGQLCSVLPDVVLQREMLVGVV